MPSDYVNPFATIAKLERDCGADWSNYQAAVDQTKAAEAILIEILHEEEGSDRILGTD
ncbi:hypothetical protein QEH56_14515 [Pelagicoccus enzymogenes]|uniref:hypothetical protein n=1 Tax=Pelagicoccus enzymogenes TaxID=2773457 RepID=UPI0028105930|nr:hypothetical protein [Pelagicoccus enzymogenes]MDQ8199376.1 hypothetical protein [Pelagicoccus enzymogenes]